MPQSDELPESLAGLARRNAIVIRDNSWHYDVGRLVRTLETIDRERVQPLDDQYPSSREGTHSPGVCRDLDHEPVRSKAEGRCTSVGARRLSCSERRRPAGVGRACEAESGRGVLGVSRPSLAGGLARTRILEAQLRGEAHDLDDTPGVRVLGRNSKRATALIQALRGLDENVQTGRIDEAVSRELDEHVSVARSTGLFEHALEVRRRGEVDFAPDGHEACAVPECLNVDCEWGAGISIPAGVIGVSVW
jgi:hypothetical protein